MPDARYPHMMPDDLPVWIRWLDLHEPDWLRIDYDVKVGAGIELDPDFEEPYRSNAVGLSKKRIDAVLIYPDKHVIVEVKGLADWKAIGQIMGYPVLYERYIKPDLPVIPLLIAAAFTLDLQDIMDHYELPYDLVPLPETETQNYTPVPLT